MFWKRNDAAIVNRLDSLHGLVGANNDAVAELVADKLVKVLAPKAELEISEQFDLGSSRMVTEISNSINKRLNDAIDGVKAQSTGHLGALVNAIYKTHHVSLSKAKDIESRLAVIEGTNLDMQAISKRNTHVLDDAITQSNQNFEELGRTLSVFDASNGDRMLTLFNRLRELEHQMGHRHMMTHAKMASQYASLSAQINDLRPKDRVQYTVEPSLEWVIDNMDGLINMVNKAVALRDNHVPRDTGLYHLVQAIRKLHLYSVTDVKDEVVNLLNSWDNQQSFCRAA